MAEDLEIITRYLDGGASKNVDAVVALFDPNAVVVDEGITYQGADAIRTWQEDRASASDYSASVLSSETTGVGEYRVAARLDGNSPGDSVDLDLRFVIRDSLITGLTIAS